MGTLYVSSGIFSSDIYVNSITAQSLFMTIGNGLADVSTNTAIGVSALATTTTNATFNTASGYFCMNALTTGSNNTASGASALQFLTTGSNNCAIGYQSGYRIIGGNNNTACGALSLDTLRYGNNNAAYGTQSLEYLTNTGNVAGVCNENSAIGYLSGQYDVSGSYNTYLGATTGCIQNSSNTCLYSTAIGYGATISASNQIVVGRSSERVYIPGIMGIGKYNTATANLALDISGNVNISGSLLYNLTATTLSVTSLTTTKDSYVNQATIGMGNSDVSTNTAFGFQALFVNSTNGRLNSAFGYQALSSNTDGSGNSAMGYQALDFNTTGSNNSAMGYQALYSNTTGSNNSAMGVGALQVNTTGSNNTAMGQAALYRNTTGSNNSALGFSALQYVTTSSNNSFFLSNVSGLSV
jgi:hypothetical protein